MGGRRLRSRDNGAISRRDYRRSPPPRTRLRACPPQNSMVVGAQVAHPVRFVAHHRDQVALTLVVDDNDRKRDLAPGLAASNLDGGGLAGSDARRKGDAEQAA